MAFDNPVFQEKYPLILFSLICVGRCGFQSSFYVEVIHTTCGLLRGIFCVLLAAKVMLRIAGKFFVWI